MKKSILVLLCAMCVCVGLGVASSAYLRAEDATPATQPSDAPPNSKPFNTKCPVTGEDVDASVQTVKYDGKIYGFCCADCVGTFKKDPAKYASKAK
jgi:YHS domain-containing protein